MQNAFKIDLSFASCKICIFNLVARDALLKFCRLKCLVSQLYTNCWPRTIMA